MSGFTTRDFKAIRFLCDSAEARPMLTVYPTVTVQVKATGEVITMNLADLHAQFDEHRKDQARERARARQDAKR